MTLLAVAATPTPVLVELFTSEGCSSCPQADQALQWLEGKQPVEGVEVIPLSLHVDYWNHLGWADPFSSRGFSNRQATYGKETYTPQMIIDGDAAFVGSKDAAVEALSERRGEPRVAIKLAAKLGETKVEVKVAVEIPSEHGASAESAAPLWVALTESGLSHPVTRGENSGKTLSHSAVVRTLVQLGPSGKVELALERGWKREQLKVVAFVQQAGPGKVLGVAWVKP